MTPLQAEIQKKIDEAAKVYDSKFIEEGNFVNSFHCAESFKAGANLLMPVILKLIEQRDGFGKTIINYYYKSQTYKSMQLLLLSELNNK